MIYHMFVVWIQFLKRVLDEIYAGPAPWARPLLGLAKAHMGLAHMNMISIVNYAYSIVNYAICTARLC